MPLKDDFIQRTLEQLAAAVRALAGLQQTAGSAQELERLIQAAYRQHTGSEALLLRQLGSAELLAVLSSAGVLDREKAYLLAALNEAEAALAARRGEGVADFQLKALDLYLEAALADLDLPELDKRIGALEAELSGYLLPEATDWRLFAHARLQRRYAEAENRLFALLERLGPTPEVERAGRAFYQELASKEDAALAAGGLPRAEVSEGQAAFETALTGK